LEKIPSKPYLAIVESCESDLEKYGDTFLGVGWTKSKKHADLRYKIMLELLRERTEVSLLDVGCGACHLLEYMTAHNVENVRYCGIDLSESFLALSRRKFPNIELFHRDILSLDFEFPRFDYVVMNGLFNWRGQVSHDEMWAYMQTMLLRAFEMADRGIAFNVMSKYLDWERDDLFHLSFDCLAQFLDGKISRHFAFRHDYGLFEYTVYVYKEALTP